MRRGETLIAVMMMLFATGCATGTATRYVDTSCAWVEPIRPSKYDVLTDGTARQILNHNESWRAVCGG